MKIPKLLIGAPGVGKTASIRSQYEHCEVLLLSSCTEEDIAGLPYREDNKERRTMPPFIERIREAVKNKKKTCLFLDEMDKARREVADTLLTLITHPQHFGISEEVDIVAAANPPEWGGGDGISQPMLTRFAVINYKPNVEKWAEITLKEFSHVPFVFKLVERISNGEIPLLESVGEGLDFRLTSPRTWHLAIHAMQNKEYELIAGLLTPNAGTALLSMAEKQRGRIEEVQEISRQIGSTKIRNTLRI